MNSNYQKFINLFDGLPDKEVTFLEIVKKLKEQKYQDSQLIACLLCIHINHNPHKKITIQDIRDNPISLDKIDIDNKIKKEVEVFFEYSDADYDDELTYKEVFSFYKNRGDNQPEARTLAIFSVLGKQKTENISKEECKMKVLNR